MNPVELEISYDPPMPHGKKFTVTVPETGEAQAISESEAQIILGPNRSGSVLRQALTIGPRITSLYPASALDTLGLTASVWGVDLLSHCSIFGNLASV